MRTLHLHKNSYFTLLSISYYLGSKSQDDDYIINKQKVDYLIINCRQLSLIRQTSTNCLKV